MSSPVLRQPISDEKAHAAWQAELLRDSGGAPDVTTADGSVFRWCPERGCERYRSLAHRHGRHGYPGKRDPNNRINPMTGEDQDRYAGRSA